jgi:hypothetical protein
MIDFDVITFPLSGKLTVDGVAPTASCSGEQVTVDLHSGAIPKSFLDPILGNDVTASVDCAATDGSFAARVPAGTYGALASQEDTSSSFPGNGTFAAATGLSVAGPVTGLTWALTTVPISGKLTVDGQAPTASCTGDQVEISLIAADGAEFTLFVPCSASDGSFSGRVAPGTYTALVSQEDTSSSFPANGTFVAATGLSVTGPTSGLDWALTTVPISGKLTVDGQAPTASCTRDQVEIELTDAGGGDFTVFVPCSASDGAFSGRVAPGTYTVQVSQEDTSSSFPGNGTFVAATGLSVSSATKALAWSLTTVPIAGKLTVDGQAPTASCTGDQVEINLGGEGGAEFTLFVPCSASDGSFSGRVAPGTYTALVSQEDTSSSFPGNGTFVAATGLSVSSATPPLVWGLTTVPMGGKILVDGQAPTASCAGDQVSIALYDTHGGSFTAFVPCSAVDGSFSARVAPGTYRFLASQEDSSSSFPAAATFNLQDAIAIP